MRSPPTSTPSSLALATSLLAPPSSSFYRQFSLPLRVRVFSYLFPILPSMPEILLSKDFDWAVWKSLIKFNIHINSDFLFFLLMENIHCNIILGVARFIDYSLGLWVMSTILGKISLCWWQYKSLISSSIID